MNCTEAKDALSALLDNALTSDEAREAEAHASSCAGCRAWRTEMAEVRQLLRGIDDGDEPPGLSAFVGREVMAAIHGRLLGTKPAPSPERSARRIAWAAAGFSALALAAAAGWAAWESSRRGEKRPDRPAVASPSAEKTSSSVKPDPEPVRPPPPEVPDEPPRPARTHYGHLELRATDAGTRDAARDLFSKWPGTFKSSEPSVSGAFALTIDFEGPASDAADEFEKLLLDFQRKHGASLRSWKYSSETR
ncbi:MAG: hypothetical protein FD180_2864 [Planctomycetota bacterium]|nr:MAG: hypothetical protein FD180_2864 [Planctomycetota bacterium]